jgi:hypothetical protein
MASVGNRAQQAHADGHFLDCWNVDRIRENFLGMPGVPEIEMFSWHCFFLSALRNWPDRCKWHSILGEVCFYRQSEKLSIGQISVVGRTPFAGWDFPTLPLD